MVENTESQRLSWDYGASVHALNKILNMLYYRCLELYLKAL